MAGPDIAWIDEFYGHVKPLIFVRREDSLLIIVPNQAYRLNAGAVRMLERMGEGEQVGDILAGFGDTPERRQEVHDFFCDLRAALMGCLREGTGRRAVELVPYHLPFNSLPVLSEIALTYRCNLACRFCYAGCTCRRQKEWAWFKKRSAASSDAARNTPHLRMRRSSLNRAKKWVHSCFPNRIGAIKNRVHALINRNVPVFRGEMRTAEVRRVLDVIWREAQVPSVSFTGGEPVLREDLPKLVRHARSLGMRVNLITNGTLLTAERVTALAEAGLNSAQVSLESASPAQHDFLTRTPGSWEATVAGIEELRRAGITCHTNTTLTALTAPAAPGLVSLACELGLTRLSMNMVIPTGSASRDLWLRYSELGPVVEAVRRRARTLGVEFLWYSPTPYCLYNPVAHGLGNKGCAACDGLLSVSPTGEVLPCSSVPRGVGNLLRRDFRRIWTGRRARRWRDKRFAHKTCRACKHFELCTGGCPIYWKAVGYEELRNAK